MLQKIKENKYIILSIILYILFFLQLQNLILYGDDYTVTSPISYTAFGQKWNFVMHILDYMWNEWSGRVIGHFLVSSSLSFVGLTGIRVLTPILFAVMIFLICTIINLFKKIEFSKYFFFLSFLIIGANIHFTRETIYWSYTIILYFWAFILTLYTVYRILDAFLKKKKLSIIQIIVLSVLSIIQSFVLEQHAIIILLLLFILFCYNLSKKKFSYDYVIIALFCFIAFIVSTLAPGNVGRTIPLASELEGFNLFEIVICKIHILYKLLFNNYFFGLYTSFLVLLMSKRYLNQIKNDKKYKYIPLLFCYSYFILIFISNLFNINLFINLNDMSAGVYLDTMFASYELSNTIFTVIYFTLYMVCFGYMCFKCLKKEYKFLLWILVISFVSALPGILFIRYSGLRYLLYYLISCGVISLVLFDIDKEKTIDIFHLLLYVGILPINIFIRISILLIIIIINFILKNKEFKLNKIIIVSSFVLYCSINFGVAFYNYNLNKKIYDADDEILRGNINSKSVLYEIPYKRSLYTWHTSVVDFENKHTYYTFYLGDWVESYYGLETELGDIKVIAWDGE